MPKRTINQGFTEFLWKLTPTDGESYAAQNHRASIKSCLERHFRRIGFFRTGSFGNGTSISGCSDVDYFAVLPLRDSIPGPKIVLGQVREALANRFPHTGVRVSWPAVVLPFGTDAKETTEITPAYSVQQAGAGGHSVYKIPGYSGNWILSGPTAHNAYVRDVDRLRGGKVKPLIRFIKAWKYYREIPISSFYLELRVAKYAAEKSSRVYDLDVMGVLSHLKSIDLAAMQDPMGISGNIRPCNTGAKLDVAKSRLATALACAQKACYAENRGHTKEAFGWWDRLYAGKFPRYYSR